MRHAAEEALKHARWMPLRVLAESGEEMLGVDPLGESWRKTPPEDHRRDELFRAAWALSPVAVLEVMSTWEDPDATDDNLRAVLNDAESVCRLIRDLGQADEWIQVLWASTDDLVPKEEGTTRATRTTTAAAATTSAATTSTTRTTRTTGARRQRLVLMKKKPRINRTSTTCPTRTRATSTSEKTTSTNRTTWSATSKSFCVFLKFA
ncbi:hypothetical protein M885DRAFT_512504 [Pelagophyceae sp. CCMP2097]|nr:hypothetical protein M885DRAFT_512504 [Pelagophyceae sp. CCMP2097]